MQALIVEYIRVLYCEDSLVGVDGRPVTPINPPSFKKGETAQLLQGDTIYCCAEMEYRMKENMVGFGNNPDHVYRNKQDTIYIRGAGKTDIPLAYCPWCARPLICFEVAKYVERPVKCTMTP